MKIIIIKLSWKDFTWFKFLARGCSCCMLLCCSVQCEKRSSHWVHFLFFFIFSPRMMALRPGAEQNMMVEVNYRQNREGTTLDTLVQDLYLCASMEFLLTVADIFLKATQQGFAQAPQHKSSSGGGDNKKNINSSVTSKESSEFTLFCFSFVLCLQLHHLLLHTVPWILHPVDIRYELMSSSDSLCGCCQLHLQPW